MVMPATAVVFLSLWVAQAVRPLPKALLEPEANGTEIEAPSHASFEEAKREIVGASSSPEALPPCVLPRSGHHVLNTSMTFDDSCVWRGEEGLKVTLEAPLTFKGNLLLDGELRVEAAGPLNASCVTVLGTLSLNAARAVFVGCTNEAGDGGALYANANFLLSHSHLRFENCTARGRGGGFFVKKDLVQEARSTLEVERCTTEAREAASGSDGGGAHVSGSFRQSNGSSARFQNCRAYRVGGGLFVNETLHQDAQSTLEVESCTAKRGGGAYVNGSFRQSNASSARFQKCRAHSVGAGGGGLFVQNDLVQETWSTLEVESCAAEFGIGGGGAYVSGSFRQSNSSAGRFQNCRAKSEGGGLSVRDLIQDARSTIEVESCTAFRGGGADILGSFRQSNASSARFHNCTAKNGGGGLFVNEILLQDAKSTLEVKSCATSEWGGGAAVSGSFRQSNGSSARFQNCTAKSGGGCLYVEDLLLQEAQSTLEVRSCATAHRGGGTYVRGSFRQGNGSSARFQNCTAANGGGGLVVNEDLLQEAQSALEVENCTAADGLGGGAAVSRLFRQSNGSSARFQNCRAKSGGALQAMNVSVASGGTVSIWNSSAASSGGAVRVSNVSVASGGTVHIWNSSAGSSGGGLDAGTLEVVSGQVVLENCFANYGGGIFSKSGLVMGLAGQVQLSKCAALFDGGGLFLQSGRLLGHAVPGGDLIIEDGIAVKGRGGGLFLGSGDIKMRRGTFARCSGAARSGGDIFANGTVTISVLRHHSLSEEAMSSSINNEQPLSLNIASVDPPQESGVLRNPDNTTLAFYTCPPGFVRLAGDAGSCVKCPLGPTKECSSRRLELEGGFMVDLADPANLSQWYRCPNAQACPGGVVEAAEVEGERPRILKPMCQEGFIGLGCAMCNSTTHARADRSVLQCAKCSNSRLEVSLQMLFYAVTDTSLFACAALSVLNAGSKKTNSGVLLNQLMAFTAVSGSIMSGMMQSQSFGQLQDDTKTWLHGLGLAVDVVQGQSSTSDMSLECVLHYFGIEQSLFNAHCLSSIMPLILIALLAVANNPWLAMVVGTNVFLPGFVAFFGKYLVMLRLRPEKDPVGEARFEYLPRFGFLPAFFPADLCAITAILLAILVCGAAGVSGWLYTVFRHHDSPPAHVKYLTMAYKPEFAYWEVERLVRKTLLLLAKFTLPIMVSPALQMEAIAIILMLSVALYVVCRPYEIGTWNWAESGLLLVGLLMTTLTTCLLANDLHWAHSQGTQVALIFLICSLAGGISIGMAVLIAFALLSERQERQAAKKQRKEAEAVMGVARYNAASLRAALCVGTEEERPFGLPGDPNAPQEYS